MGAVVQTEPAGTWPGWNSSGLAVGGLADRPALARDADDQ